MLTGTASYEELASGGAHMPSLDTEAVSFRGAELFQLLCEIDSSVVEELLPPSLHPTLPGIVTWQVLDCPDSPWGRNVIRRVDEVLKKIQPTEKFWSALSGGYPESMKRYLRRVFESRILGN